MLRVANQTIMLLVIMLVVVCYLDTAMLKIWSI
jgi:hypothetical protein